MSDLPSGFVTFLFTDIEGSTRLWEEYPEEMRIALNRHNEIIRKSIEECHGIVFKTAGDAFYTVFVRAQEAIVAACEVQTSLLKEPWPTPAPLRVRIALHSAEMHPHDGDYFGPPLNLLARLLGRERGGHVLLSSTTEAIVKNEIPEEITIRDIGEQSMRDMGDPVRIFQLVHPSLPAEYPIHRFPRAFQNNLPLELSRFVGREREQKEIRELLSQARLVTLTGTGGIGKTRLALKVAASVLENFPDGVWLAELASITNPEFVPQALASALSAHEESGSILMDTLSEYLRSRKLLIVLDNCEHLVEACARIAGTLLRTSPGLRILATSRQPLGIEGETIWRVPCLTFPDSCHAPGMEDLIKYEAVNLFAERARSVKASFELNEENAPSLIEICRQLDGIPLAIELAAVRIKFLSMKQLAEKLKKQFEILTAETRTTLPQHQTLRRAVDWSYELITEEEKTVFRRLSVFVGGFKLEAAAAVCVGERVHEDRFLDLLSDLVDKSFVLVMEGAEEEVRYRILEPLRQYGLEKLLEFGEKEEVIKQYCDYFLAFSEAGASSLSGTRRASWLKRLEEEHDNIRKAMDLCAPLHGLRFATALYNFWDIRGYFAEGWERLTFFLSKTETKEATRMRAQALLAAGGLAISLGDFALSRPLLEESYQIFRDLQDKKGCARALRKIGVAASWQGNLEEYKNYAEKSLKLFQELEDDLGIAACLNDLANIAGEKGDRAAAISLYEKSLAVCEKIGDKDLTPLLICNIGVEHELKGNHLEARSCYEKYLAMSREFEDKGQISFALYNLGNVATKLGDYALARSYFKESLEILRYLKDKLNISLSLESLAELERKEGKLNRAVRLFARAESLRQAISSPLPLPLVPAHDQSIAELREALGEEAFEEGWGEGAKMSVEAAIEFGLCGRESLSRPAQDIPAQSL